MSRLRMTLLPVLGLLLLSLACGESGQGDSGGPAKPGQAEAKSLFSSLCATCHDKTGQGDGAAAANLDPKPRSFSDKEWQKSVTDEHLRKVIVEGGLAVGKSISMPPAPQLKGKKDVLDRLVEIIRAYGR